MERNATNTERNTGETRKKKVGLSILEFSDKTNFTQHIEQADHSNQSIPSPFDFLCNQLKKERINPLIYYFEYDKNLRH